jgi:hypothetical protein
VSGGFTLASPLPANSSLTQYLDVTAWSLSDGVQTINSTDTDLSDFFFATSGGQISQWQMTLFVVTSGNLAESAISTEYAPGSPNNSDEGFTSYAFIEAYNTNDPGTWIVTTPEPLTSSTMLVGLVLSVIAIWHQRRGSRTSKPPSVR